MSIEAAIYTTLSGDAGVTALVSTRCYPGTLPQNVTLPAVKFQRTSTDLASAMSSDPGPYSVAFQFTCVDEGDGAYLSCLNIANAVKTALVRLSGTVGSVTIQDSFLLDEDDTFEDNPERFGRLLRIEFHYEV